jgi:hypothetical protein
MTSVRFPIRASMGSNAPVNRVQDASVSDIKSVAGLLPSIKTVTMFCCLSFFSRVPPAGPTFIGRKEKKVPRVASVRQRYPGGSYSPNMAYLKRHKNFVKGHTPSDQAVFVGRE